MRASARATAAAQSAALHALQGWKWQTLTVGEALSLCASRASGLTGAEVLAARAAYGRNVAPAKPGPGLLRRVWAQLANALMASLVVAAVVAAVFTDWADFVLISLIIIINVLIGLLTEGKAASAAAALQRLLAPRSTVLRDGQLVVVDTAEVVVGDILHVQAGDSLGADVRFISAASLRCLESALTGESEPVDKSILAQPGGGGSVGDWACCNPEHDGERRRGGHAAAGLAEPLRPRRLHHHLARRRGDAAHRLFFARIYSGIRVYYCSGSSRCHAARGM